MRFTKKPQSEPIAGYRLLEPMGSGGFGEVWKCEAPGGLLKAIKFVYGNLNSVGAARAPAQEELDAIQRVKAIRHPFLLQMERVESVQGELVIVMELADKNLSDRLAECTQAGLAGIPREELLGYMTEAAEALDLMNVQHNLQHLDIKPHNLFLVYNHVKVGDFGLVHSMGGPGDVNADSLSVTPLYASPETFLGKVSSHSDQYSLAIVYQELLTRTLPFTGKNARQLLLLHTSGEPDLRALPEWDRPAVAKALAKDPKARFPTCGHFVRALVTGWIPNQLAAVAGLEPAPPLLEEAVQESPTPTHEQTADVTPPDVSAPAVETLPTHAPAHEETAAELTSATVQRAALTARYTAERSLVLRDYTLRERIRTSPVHEVWRAGTPDGNDHLITQLFGWTLRGDPLERAFRRLQALRHPTLLEPTVLQCEPGRLVVATDPVERSLRDRLHECQAQGLSGIPRDELLSYLGTAAAALDELFRAHQVAHLGLSARHLLLDNGSLRIAEFGLAQLFWLPARHPDQFFHGRAAAPELFEGKVSSFCDQYSLALLFMELLTGVFPRRTPLRGSTATTSTSPGLSAWGGADRAVLLRALDPTPEDRWPSLTEFVQALGGEVPATGSRMASVVSPTSRPTKAAPAGQRLRGKFSANLTPDTMRQRFEGFRYQWNATLLRGEEDRFVFHITLLNNLWQQSAGQQPGLEVEVQVQRAPSVPNAPAEVVVLICPVGCDPEQGKQFLQEMGNLLYESLQAHLHAVPQRRTEERLPWHYPLQVRPISGADQPGEPIECQGKDISLNGIGFYAAVELPPTQVALVLPQTPQTPRVTTLANIVRVKRCGAGWFEIGAVLLTPAPRAEEARAHCGSGFRS